MMNLLFGNLHSPNNFIMSKVTTRSTGKSIGLLSEKQIDIWGNQGKRHARVFEKKKTKASQQLGKRALISNQQEMDLSFSTSLNRLREKTRSERSNTSSISNRMNYMEVDLRRKKQMVEIAKTKYQRMIEVRQKSFVEKKSLIKERESFLEKHQQSVSLKASKIKFERGNSSISSQIWREKNQEEAMKIKDRRFRNERMIAQREQMEVEKKRELVEKSHQTMDLSRSKLREMKEKRIEAGKNQHNLKMFDQYLRGEMQRRKNTKLVQNFKEKVKRIEADSTKIVQELEQYEMMLGHRPLSRAKDNKNRPNSRKDPLFVTN